MSTDEDARLENIASRTERAAQSCEHLKADTARMWAARYADDVPWLRSQLAAAEAETTREREVSRLAHERAHRATARADAAEARVRSLQSQLSLAHDIEAGAYSDIATLTRERDELRSSANEAGDACLALRAQRDEAVAVVRECRCGNIDWRDALLARLASPGAAPAGDKP